MTEIALLERKHKEKSDELQRLEADWKMKRSDLLKSMIGSRVAEIELNSAMRSAQPLPKGVDEALTKQGIEPKPDERWVREIAEVVKKDKDRTDAIRTEATPLWDRAAAVRAEDLEIQAALELQLTKRRGGQNAAHLGPKSRFQCRLVVSKGGRPTASSRDPGPRPGEGDAANVGGAHAGHG